MKIKTKTPPAFEQRLVNILNTFEESLLKKFKGDTTNFSLKNSYIDLKYEVVKLLLEATHREASNFSFDLFVEKAKESSPLMQNDIENPEL